MFHVSLLMAIDTPGHSHRCNTGNTVHRLDGTVAFLAGDACSYVSLVRKVNEIRDVVHLDPGNRLTIVPVRHQLRYLRTLSYARHGTVTTHALADTRHAGYRRLVRVDVAVLARNLIVRCMHRVAEFDWLDRRTIREILAVHKYAYQKSKRRHHPEKKILFRGPERIGNGDRQIVSPSFGQRVCPEDAQTTNVCAAAVSSVGLDAHPIPRGVARQIMRTLVRSGLLLLVCLIAGPVAQAAGDVEKGKVLYNICTACHGPNAEGIPALNAPANAGQDPWYLTRQLKNFRVGIRGAHPGDTFGAQMRPMAMMLADEQDITDVVAYLTSITMPEPELTVEGDIEAGRKAYVTCVPCHGEYGEGAKALDAPRLSNQHDWYLVRQLDNFKAGIRGSHQNDIYGAQMRIMAQMLQTDEQVRDVSAYIATIDYRPGGE